MKHTNVLILSALFWAGGAIICLGFAAVNILVRAPTFSGDKPINNRWMALGIGLAIGLLQGFCLFARLAKKDARRICALDSPRWHQFFPKLGLLAVFSVAMTCAVTENLTKHLFPAVLIFGGVLTCVGVSLTIGCLHVLAFACSQELRDAAATRPERLDDATVASGQQQQQAVVDVRVG